MGSRHAAVRVLELWWGVELDVDLAMEWQGKNIRHFLVQRNASDQGEQAPINRTSEFHLWIIQLNSPVMDTRIALSEKRCLNEVVTSTGVFYGTA